jgi:hypothetical protein
MLVSNSGGSPRGNSLRAVGISAGGKAGLCQEASIVLVRLNSGNTGRSDRTSSVKSNCAAFYRTCTFVRRTFF